MLKNGKLFLPPPKDGSDFKELFKQVAAAGAGRPLGADGFPAGPWTPELLVEAISQIDSNRIGVDLRTVQLWFQDNEKGISIANIRWLARIFGCDDPVATSEWQMELSAAQTLLTAKRRDSKKAESSVALRVPDQARTATVDDETKSSAELARDTDANRTNRRFGLAMRSEALFSRGSPLNLPASVFAGASALGFLSYIVGIHSATYSRADGLVKQVGFLWAPNWTFLFMVLLPLFFAFVIELLGFWKHDVRCRLVAPGDRLESDDAWTRNVQAYSYTYWAVFLICVLFAGLLQWIGVCLIPLLEGGDDYATSWGTLAIAQPDVISVPVSIVFTALAYLYMCLCFYLFFAGLILLHTIVHDLWRIEEASTMRPVEHRREGGEIGLRVMRGIFRCTVLGILVAICMKVQSSYLSSNGGDIVTWIAHDMSSALYERHDGGNSFSYRMPTHYSSLLVVISTCIVFLYGSIRLGVGKRFRVPLWRMSAVVGLLFASYLLIDAFEGFSILVGVGVLLATYGLFDPEFGRWRASELGSNQSVS
ncbi:RcgA family putative transporter [Rhizobium aegyptiacum]|uniref:RcgA family putative transporter n=1 Tax=Rhizobium aegyptiacum TaxID=1764550 RepID=UPI0007E5997F|nr:hypothetical protein [Rhizobium aegyptiacum]